MSEIDDKAFFEQLENVRAVQVKPRLRESDPIYSPDGAYQIGNVITVSGSHNSHPYRKPQQTEFVSVPRSELTHVRKLLQLLVTVFVVFALVCLALRKFGFATAFTALSVAINTVYHRVLRLENS